MHAFSIYIIGQVLALNLQNTGLGVTVSLRK
jgi:hypothetical protein